MTQELGRKPGAPSVDLRASWARILTLASITPLCAVSGTAIPYLLRSRADRPGLPFGLLVAAMTYLVVVTAAGVWLQRRNRLVLGEGELTVRSGYRTRHLRAADIQAITLERPFGSRVLTLWMADGTRLRASVAGRTEGLFRQSFDRDQRLVGEWWLANRGDHWRPGYSRQRPEPLTFDWKPTG